MKNATDFDYYDPQRIDSPEDFAFFGATIMRSLVAFKYSADPADVNTLVPDMATDIGTANADATSWTFTLRDGLTWQDGSAVTCDDVKYGVSRTFATDVINGGPMYAIEYLDIPKNDDGTSQYPGPYSATPEQQALFDAAVVCNGDKITFNVATVVPDFNYMTTRGFGAVPNPIDHPGIDTAENYVGDAVWSDGPYQITSYAPSNGVPNAGGSLIMDRNPHWNPSSDDYRGAFPDKWEVDFGLDLHVIDDRIIGSAGADAFAVDYSSMQPENLATVFSDSHTANTQFVDRAFSDYDPYVRYFWINTKTVPNRDIRAAMAAALDREQIRDNSGGDFVGDFADGVLKPNIGPDYAPTGLWDGVLGQAIPSNGDPKYAKTLIAQSGLDAPTLTWNYFASPTGDKNAATIKESLEKAGFKIKLNVITDGRACGPSGVLCNFVSDFSTGGWGSDWPNASTVIPPLFTPGAYWNKSLVDDTSGIPDWTAQVNDALTTLDRSAQALKWENLNKEAAEQVWVIPTLFDLQQRIAGTNVGGVYDWTPYSSWPYAQLYVKPSS